MEYISFCSLFAPFALVSGLTAVYAGWTLFRYPQLWRSCTQVIATGGVTLCGLFDFWAALLGILLVFWLNIGFSLILAGRVYEESKHRRANNSDIRSLS